jgi:hypothetical protein
MVVEETDTEADDPSLAHASALAEIAREITSKVCKIMSSK